MTIWELDKRDCDIFEMALKKLNASLDIDDAMKERIGHMIGKIKMKKRQLEGIHYKTTQSRNSHTRNMRRKLCQHKSKY